MGVIGEPIEIVEIPEPLAIPDTLPAVESPQRVAEPSEVPA